MVLINSWLIVGKILQGMRYCKSTVSLSPLARTRCRLCIMGFCGTISGTSWLSKVIKFGRFLTTLGVILRVMIFRLRAGWNLKWWPNWHGDGLFALDMSSNLTFCSNYTTLLRMYPFHCLCCEVETAILSPFSLHVRSCVTLPMLLVIVVVLVFFSIVTSIVVSSLVNVVNSIRVPTRGRLGLFPFFTLPTSFPHDQQCAYIQQNEKRWESRQKTCHSKVMMNRKVKEVLT